MPSFIIMKALFLVKDLRKNVFPKNEVYKIQILSIYIKIINISYMFFFKYTIFDHSSTIF